MPGPVLSGLAIIARYAAQKGIPAAIKKYGKTQVSKAVKNKSGLSRAAESSLRELGVSGKGIRAVRKRADAKQAKAAGHELSTATAASASGFRRAAFK